MDKNTFCSTLADGFDFIEDNFDTIERDDLYERLSSMKDMLYAYWNSEEE